MTDKTKNSYGPLQQAEATVYRRNIGRIPIAPMGRHGAIISDAVVGLEFRTQDRKIIPLTFSVLPRADFNTRNEPYFMTFEDLAAETVMGSVLDIGDRVTLAYQSKTIEEKQGPIMELLDEPPKVRTTTVVRSVDTDLFLFSLKDDGRGYKLTLKKALKG